MSFGAGPLVLLRTREKKIKLTRRSKAGRTSASIVGSFCQALFVPQSPRLPNIKRFGIGFDQAKVSSTALSPQLATKRLGY